MKLFISKWIRFGFIPLLLMMYAAYKVAFAVISLPNFTQLEYPIDGSHLTQRQESGLQKGQKVTARFQANAQNLGIIAVRFDTFGKINDDEIIFRLREMGASSWYYQHSYKVDQFQPQGLFTFGFPVISDSEYKTYEFELESVKGKPSSMVAVSTKEPVFVTRHEFTRAALSSDKRNVIYFLPRHNRKNQNRFGLLAAHSVPIISIFFGKKV